MKTKFLQAMVCLLMLAGFADAQTEGLPPKALLAPEKLAAQIKDNSAPTVVFVGFPALYKGAHIKGSIFAGPCSKPEGVKVLTDSVKVLSPGDAIIIYCGCCPFSHCPNVRPAYEALKKAGFTNVKVLQLDTNLHTDWVEKGYPTETK